MHKVARDPSPHSHHHPRRAPFPPNSSLSLSLASLHQSSQPRSVTGLQCLPATVQTPCGSSPWCTHIHFRRSSFHAHAFLPVVTQCRPADINRGKRAAAPVSNRRPPFSSSRNHQVKEKEENVRQILPCIRSYPFLRSPLAGVSTFARNSRQES